MTAPGSAAGGVPPLRVPMAEIDFESDLVHFYRGCRFTGVAFEEDPVHGLSEISFRDGLQDGPARDWSVDGRLTGESWFRENVLHGVSREYREDGSVAVEMVHEFGIPVRRSTIDETGRAVDEFVLREGDPNHALLLRLRRENPGPGPRPGPVDDPRG